jgi:hypothetical protein
MGQEDDLMAVPDSTEIRDALDAYYLAERALAVADDRLRAAAKSADGGDEQVLFLAGGMCLWAPTSDLRCVGITTRGVRCRNPVFDEGQVWFWRGPFAVPPDEEWVYRLLTQTCRVHASGKAEYLQTEWVAVPVDDGLRRLLPW